MDKIMVNRSFGLDLVGNIVEVIERLMDVMDEFGDSCYIEDGIISYFDFDEDDEPLLRLHYERIETDEEFELRKRKKEHWDRVLGWIDPETTAIINGEAESQWNKIEVDDG